MKKITLFLSLVLLFASCEEFATTPTLPSRSDFSGTYNGSFYYEAPDGTQTFLQSQEAAVYIPEGAIEFYIGSVRCTFTANYGNSFSIPSQLMDGGFRISRGSGSFSGSGYAASLNFDMTIDGDKVVYKGTK